METINVESAKAITGFLKSVIPASSAVNIETELKKDFVLGKKTRKAKKKPKRRTRGGVLTRKQKKALGFYSIPRDSIKYTDISVLHERWLQYISTVVDFSLPLPEPTSKAWENFTQSLYKADYHGSMLKVIRSKCSSYVGKQGICIMDTRNTFRIVSSNNVTTTVNKKECVFELYLNSCYKVTLLGKLLCARPADRSTKKIKGHIHPDL